MCVRACVRACLLVRVCVHVYVIANGDMYNIMGIVLLSFGYIFLSIIQFTNCVSLNHSRHTGRAIPPTKVHQIMTLFDHSHSTSVSKY